MKHSLFFILFAFITVIGKSQGFEAYAIGGFTFSQIEGDQLKGYNNFGFTAGAASNFILENDLSFQQELVYYQRGSKATDDQLNDDIFTIKELNYIDFVLLVNKKVKEKWMIQAGTGAGKLLSIKTDDPNDKVSRYGIDLFVAGGAGYFLTDNLLLNLRGQFSVKSAEKSLPYFHNNSLAFTLRWRFLLND